MVECPMCVRFYPYREGGLKCDEGWGCRREGAATVVFPAGADDGGGDLDRAFSKRAMWCLSPLSRQPPPLDRRFIWRDREVVWKIRRPGVEVDRARGGGRGDVAGG